jgi:uncharacterized membrane protein
MQRTRHLFLLTLLLGVAWPSPALGEIYTFATIDVPFPGAFQTSPTGINDSGEIAGFYLTTGLVPHGFLLSGGDFSTFDSPTGFTDFLGINNQGQIVGYDGRAGFVLTGGQFDVISVPGSTFTSAQGINNIGQIVGDTIVSNTATGFLLTDGNFSLISGTTRALGINDLSQIVGTVGTHGYLFTSGVFSPIDVLGALNTIPVDINNRGDIVGFYVEPSLILHGFILNQQGFTTIDFPGSSSTQVFGINNQGQIVGVYQDASGSHGFLATAIPEPATWLLLAAGVGGLWAMSSSTRERRREALKVGSPLPSLLRTVQRQSSRLIARTLRPIASAAGTVITPST